MWPFDSSPKQRGHIEALKDCHCGKRSYGPLKADGVYCHHCGAMYILGPVRIADPVARIVWEPDGGETTK